MLFGVIINNSLLALFLIQEDGLIRVLDDFLLLILSFMKVMMLLLMLILANGIRFCYC